MQILDYWNRRYQNGKICENPRDWTDKVKNRLVSTSAFDSRTPDMRGRVTDESAAKEYGYPPGHDDASEHTNDNAEARSDEDSVEETAD